MKKIRNVIIIALIIIILCIITFFIKKHHYNSKNKDLIEENNNVVLQENSKIQNNLEEIDSLKKEINSTANSEIYELAEEKDGRKILQIKENIQFNVDLAGIIKNGKPEESEIASLIEKRPTKSGIWISEQSRNKFLQILKNNNLENYDIAKDGFLYSNNNSNTKWANEINEMINSNKIYIINITGISYERDYISGEVIEYPFEEMDHWQIIEPYMLDNSTILEITTNKNGKIKDSEILESIIQYK